MKERSFKCRWCGATFHLHKGMGKDCPECREERELERKRLYAAVRRGIIDKDDIPSRLDAHMERYVRERLEAEKDDRNRCLFCGMVMNVVDGFCVRCRNDGLDNVYKATGRSNGWESRKTKTDVHVVGGWRGRPVAGHSIRGTWNGIQEDWS